jgi:acyl-coenzyme A synthetase/AMP-(fatty) acid ligase
MPLQFGLDIHLMGTWNPRRALDYVRSEHVSCGGGLPALCESLIRVDVLSREDWSTIKVAGLGGAPAGAQLVEKLHEHDVFVYRSYGSTEHPSVTHSGQLTPPDRLHSEGVPLPGVELRLVDEEGLPSSESEGFIETRGPDLCIGIIDSGDRSIGERDDGWFNSGDFGRLDDQHVLRDVARTGDVAKTHGSLVNLTRIELLLSNTLGESSYALLTVPSRKDSVDTDIVLVTTAPALDLRSVRSELRSRGAAPHELPARLTMVDRIPQTSLGKIDRGRLRADLERRMA